MNILLVEDNIDQAQATKYILEEFGKHTVTWMPSGQDALQVAVLEKYDCVVLDHFMVGMTSPTFIQRFRGNSGLENIPVIVTTGATQDQLETLTSLKGVWILTKPFFPQVMLELLNKV